MTAACVRKTAFDGSPITCYCPIVNTTASFDVGGPAGASTWRMCNPSYPYILSGVQTDFGK